MMKTWWFEIRSTAGFFCRDFFRHLIRRRAKPVTPPKARPKKA
jgi:hypothetical protein